MRIKTIIVAALLSLGLPFAAKAETGEDQKYQVSCGAECSQFNVAQTNSFPVEINTNDADLAQSQRRRRRVRRTRRTRTRKIYLGGTLGVFFPSELEEFDGDVVDGLDDSESIDPGTGFGGSIYGGYKFNNLLSADIEFFVFGGGANPIDDSGYTSLGFFVNPRFTFAFNKGSANSPYAFISPGLGLASVNLSDEISDRFSGDDSGSGFALQIKGGIGYPLSETIDIFGQARFFNAFQVYEIIGVGDEDDQDFNTFGLEVGVNFKL